MKNKVEQTSPSVHDDNIIYAQTGTSELPETLNAQMRTSEPPETLNAQTRTSEPTECSE